jgi:hypothetical protein
VRSRQAVKRHHLKGWSGIIRKPMRRNGVQYGVADTCRTLDTIPAKKPLDSEKLYARG